jgi:hypothetical protein
VENAKDEGRRMRRGRGRAVVGSAVHCSVSCLLLPRLCLPALYLFFFFRASVYLLCICSSSSAPLFNVFISIICNSAQKAAWSCFWLFCGLTAYGHGSHK